MFSRLQQRAKEFADRHGYKLRRISEGRVKILRPDGTEAIVNDFIDAKLFMMMEVYGTNPDKNIFDFD